MDSKILVLLLGMMLVTYIPRMLPLVLLTKLNIPPLLLCWLKYIPVAVLASLLAPEILLNNNTLNISFDNTLLLAALPAFLIAFKTKNLFYTVFMGMGSVVVLSRLIG